VSPEALLAANINPHTGLATDYLNHYNEVAMLIGMLSDMPEVAEDVLAWGPLGYAEHFTQTGFRGRDLAIAAYENAAPELLMRFQASCDTIEAEIAHVQARLSKGLPPESGTAAGLYDLIALAGAIINEGLDSPTSFAAEQALVDSLFD
jgi:hypothetical protein